MDVFYYAFPITLNDYFLWKTFSCCLNKKTDCFHETTNCFTSGTSKQSCYEFLCMVTVVSFISKPMVGQICIYCASKSNNKRIYSFLPWNSKFFYEWQPHLWSWGWWIFVNMIIFGVFTLLGGGECKWIFEKSRIFALSRRENISTKSTPWANIIPAS